MAGGVFASREEAIDAGVGLLRKREALVNQLADSRRQLDEGEFTQSDDAGLAARFEEL